MSRRKSVKPGAVVLRILIFASSTAMIGYGAVTPHEMYKVTAECVTIGIAGLSMVIQTYVTLAVYTCLPYAIWVVIGLDGACVAAWCAAIAVLSYWDRDVVYTPRDGDPDEWFQCAKTHDWEKVMTSDGIGDWMNLVWCKVELNGQDRLIGNGAARQQLHVLIGLSVVSLLFTGLVIVYTVARGRYLGLIKSRGSKLAT